MNKTIKLLTVALVLTTATQSFPMWNRLRCAASSARAYVAPRINTMRASLPTWTNRLNLGKSAVAVRPAFARTAALRTAAGFGAVAAYANYAKPAKAEEAKKAVEKAAPVAQAAAQKNEMADLAEVPTSDKDQAVVTIKATGTYTCPEKDENCRHTMLMMSKYAKQYARCLAETDHSDTNKKSHECWTLTKVLPESCQYENNKTIVRPLVKLAESAIAPFGTAIRYVSHHDRGGKPEYTLEVKPEDIDNTDKPAKAQFSVTAKVYPQSWYHEDIVRLRTYAKNYLACLNAKARGTKMTPQCQLMQNLGVVYPALQDKNMNIDSLDIQAGFKKFRNPVEMLENADDATFTKK